MRGSIAPEFAGSAFGRQSCNDAGSAENAVIAGIAGIADNAGNWI